MIFLLSFSRIVDKFSDALGRLLYWFILATTLISAGNAMIRYSFNISSNAWLEIQWYLFSAVFLLGSGFAFLRNSHVRIDFLSSKFSAKGRNWVDIIGILVFLLPLCYLMIDLGWPVFERAWVSGETSSNAGGLIRWPVFALIPLGFSFLALQAVSELIKRVAFITGNGPDPLDHTGPSEEELLAKELAAAEDARAKAQKHNAAAH